MSVKENLRGDIDDLFEETKIPIDVTKLVSSVYVAAHWTLSNGANKDFDDGDITVADDTITIAAHGFKTGMKVQLTTTGVLPAGLALTTDYWIYVEDENTIQLAASLADLKAGTIVPITGAAGGGTHTIAVEAAVGAMSLWYSSDGITKEQEVTGFGGDMATGTFTGRAITSVPSRYLIVHIAGSLVGVVSGLNIRVQGPLQ